MNKGEVWGFGGEKKDLYFPYYQLFCGNTDLKRGSAWLDGKPICISRGRGAMIRQGFGFVEEYHQGIFPKLSLLENLTLASLPRMTNGLSINYRLERVVANDMAEELGIPLKELGKPIEKTGANTRFLITIYRWFLRNSKVLVFNHVLANSDIVMRDSMLQVINRIHESDMGLIIFSSDKKELYELCDHVIDITEGKDRNTYHFDMSVSAKTE
ncbi:MAG: hypothetical protein LUC94_14350 [Clostridiales bacterium]|nr:hypothetical protein [Clostridiales bacterium]